MLPASPAAARVGVGGSPTPPSRAELSAGAPAVALVLGVDVAGGVRGISSSLVWSSSSLV